MKYGFKTDDTINGCPLQVLTPGHYPHWLSDQDSFIQNQLQAARCDGAVGDHAVLLNSAGHFQQVVAVIEGTDSVWCLAALVKQLPVLDYRLVDINNILDQHQALIGWALAHYRFDRYQTTNTVKALPNLVIDSAQLGAVKPIVDAIFWVRDLINIPANDLGPEQIYQAAVQLSEHYDATVSEIVGQDLLVDNLNAIWTVGAAGHQQPRLIELEWGDPSHPSVALVGKGVCFDTGGLDIKPANGMRLMKKDMGGAAHVLGLAKLVMAQKLPIHLHLLIPAVENNIAANAYRPGDVIQMANGTTVEVGDTDAEGRLVVADALTIAKRYQPELLIDFTTLTGAARVALGPSVAVMFSNDDTIAAALQHASEQVADPLWRLPLVASYQRYLRSDIADQNNVSKTPYGGAITAALFLQSFLPDNTPWVHFDIMAWNSEPLAGRPVGGEAMALRAVFALLQVRYKE